MKSKIDITPSEALLILIDHYQSQIPKDNLKLSQIKRLFLCGVTEPYQSLEEHIQKTDKEDVKEKSKKILTSLFEQEPCLKLYSVRYDDSYISQDPSRRFFESHLAFETLQQQLPHISVDQLQKYYRSLRSLCMDPMEFFLKNLSGVREQELDKMSEILTQQKLALNGQFEELKKLKIEEINPDQASLMYEYSYCIDALKSGHLLTSLSTEEREKIILILQCSFTALTAESFTPPVDIYRKGIYGPSMRGLESKNQPIITRKKTEAYRDGPSDTDSETLSTVSEMSNLSDEDLDTKTHNLGLMKSYQALSADDPLYFGPGLPYLKSPDRSDFSPKKAWPTISFSHLVHPFVNSISGTMLMQLRCMAELSHISVLYLNEDYETAASKNHKNCFIVTQIEGKPHLYYLNSVLLPTEIPIDNLEIARKKIEQIIIQQNNTDTLYLSQEEMTFLIPDFELYNPKTDYDLDFLQQGDPIREYLSVFISSMLAVLGGHSLYEFVASLQISEVKQAFHSVDKLEQVISLEGLFYTHNQVAFEQALDKTLEYEKRQLLKKQTDFAVSSQSGLSLKSHVRDTALRFFDQKRHQSVILPQILQNTYDEKIQSLLKNLQLIKNPISGMFFPVQVVNTLIQMVTDNDISDALRYMDTVSIPSTLKSPFDGQERALPEEHKAPMVKWKQDTKKQLVALESLQEKLAPRSTKSNKSGF